MLTCDYKGKTIIAPDEEPSWLRSISRNDELRCRECEKRVIFRKGTFRPHFYHYRKENCSLTQESQEHDKGKNFIRDLLATKYSSNQIFLEEVVESNQRVDVLLVASEKRYAFEVQFSSQTDEKWKERTDDYKKIGIEPIWILGYKNNITELFQTKYYNEKDDIFSNVRIKLGRTKHNAGIETNHQQETQSHYIHQKFSDYRIFHILTVSNGKCKLYIGYLQAHSKTIFYGTVAHIGKDWEFSEMLSRFIPSVEQHFNAVEEKIRAEIWKRENLRRGLNKRVLEYAKCDFLHEIPEIKIQLKRMPLPDLMVFSTKSKVYYEHDVLLAEIAIYLKFVKIKPEGFSFSLSDDIVPFMNKWGLISAENERACLVQIAIFLDRLCRIEVLDKETTPNCYVVTGKKIIKE